MAVGRSFLHGSRIGASPVVILAWGLYQQHFHSDYSVLGKQFVMDATPYTVVGVLPRWFNYSGPLTQLWVPYASVFTPEMYGHHDFHQTLVVARLRPGLRPQQQSVPSARFSTRCISQISTLPSLKMPSRAP